ncbi:MAG TPA: hypothetical protein VGJ07_32415 [Rugosimonospora sp.]
MPNVQQPEMRRSGRDPLVQDSSEDRAQGAGRDSGRSRGRPVPEAQQSPYGPKAPTDRRVQSGVEPEADET